METIWFEKYRPKTINEFIFPNADLRYLVTKFIENENIPHLLISGIQGTGKTTLARILISNLIVHKKDKLIINASSETGINNIRDVVEPFCKTMSFNSLKIVLLEEADGLSNASQKALRSIMEEYHERVRFIMTCNYPQKIISPLHSRMQHIHINTLDMDHVTEYICSILEKETVKVDDLSLISEHIETFYPDMRKIINSIQESSVTGTLKGVFNNTSSGTSFDVWENIWKTNTKFNDALEDMISCIKEISFDNVDEIYRVMYDNILNYEDINLSHCIKTIAEYLYRSSIVADQEINLVACLLEMSED